MVILNNLLSRRWNILLKTISLQIVFCDINFLLAFFTPLRWGEPILVYLHRCGGFAVDNHSFIRRRFVTESISTRE